MSATDRDRYWFVHSPEDILLQKLLWYRQGGDVSDRQWRDALAMIIVQGPRLDRDDLAGNGDGVGRGRPAGTRVPRRRALTGPEAERPAAGSTRTRHRVR